MKCIALPYKCDANAQLNATAQTNDSNPDSYLQTHFLKIEMGTVADAGQVGNKSLQRRPGFDSACAQPQVHQVEEAEA